MAGTITSPIILEGFESGRNPTAGTVVGSLVTTVTGTVAPYATNPRGAGSGGAYSLRCNPSAATGFWRWTLNTENVLVLRFGLRLNSMPASATTTLVTIAHNGSGNSTLAYNSTSGNLELACSGSSTQTAAVSTGTWILVELYADLTANPNFIDWTVDGVAKTRSSVAQAADSFWQLTIGIQSSATADIQIDDLVVTMTSGDYPIGDGYIKPIWLDGTVGTHNLVVSNNIQWSSDGSTYTDVASSTDTLPATTLDDNQAPWPSAFPGPRLRQSSGTGNGSYVDLNLTDITATPRAVGAQVLYGAASTTACTGATWLYDDGGNTKEIYGVPGTPRDHSETSCFVRGCPSYWASGIVASLTPASGSWTSTKLNSCKVRMGASGDVTPNPYWFGVLVQYDFVPTTTAASGPALHRTHRPFFRSMLTR